MSCGRNHSTTAALVNAGVNHATRNAICQSKSGICSQCPVKSNDCQRYGVLQAIQADANAEDAIEELIDGQDYYRENLIPKKLKSLPIRLIVLLSGKADKSSQAEAKRAAIELLDHSVVVKLLGREAVTPVDLQEMERTRLQDLREIFL